jgi:two-component system, OmpR family, phosphate regulon sensor histidine kinase PhoR
MVAAIVLLIAFQSWWLWQTFKDERREIRYRTNNIFRESVWQLQSEKLKIDSSMRVRLNAGRQMAAIMNLMRNQHMVGADSVIIRRQETGMQSAHTSTATALPGGPTNVRRVMFEMITGIDSLQDSLTISEIDARYRQQLNTQGFQIDYSIKRVKTKPPKEDGSPNFERNEVPVGFVNPITYRLDIDDTTAYVLKKLSPQILFSLFLVALTISSFLILIKNLLRQQRLTVLKNDFINNVTHELKTPIATVNVAIEALKSFNAMNDEQRRKEYLEISSNELNRLNMLVDKVLKISMFERKELELKTEPIKLDAVVKEVTQSMQLQFEKHGAKVDVQPDGNDFSMSGDKMHITSVVYNLLDNALKYSKESPVIHVGLQQREAEIVLTVKDNGIGISPIYRNKIFDKFFRVPHGDRHDVKGYGLGLSYVAQVVKEHNGRIEVVSEEGKGSTFTVRFPKREL